MGNAQRKDKDAAKASQAAKQPKESGNKTLQEESQSTDDAFENIQRDEIKGIDAHGATETNNDDEAVCNDLLQRLDAFSTPVETVSQPEDSSKDIPLHETTTELFEPVSSEAQYLEQKVAESYFEDEDKKSEPAPQEESAAPEPEKAEADSKEQPFEAPAAEERTSIPQQQEEIAEIKHDNQIQNGIDTTAQGVLTGDPVVDNKEVEVAGTAVPLQETPLGGVQEIEGNRGELLTPISSEEQPILESKQADEEASLDATTTDAIADAQEVVRQLSAEKSKDQAETKDDKEAGQSTAGGTAEGHETGLETVGGDIVEGSASVGYATLAETSGGASQHDDTSVEGGIEGTGTRESSETPALESEQAETPEVKGTEVSEAVAEEDGVGVADQPKTPEIEQKADFQDVSQEKSQDNAFEESLDQDTTKVPESSIDEESSRGVTSEDQVTAGDSAEGAEVADLVDTVPAEGLEKETPVTEDSSSVAGSESKFAETEPAEKHTVADAEEESAVPAVDIEGHASNAGDEALNGSANAIDSGTDASLESETPAVEDVKLDATSSDAVNDNWDVNEVSDGAPVPSEVSVPSEEGRHETVPSEETKDDTVSAAKAANEDVMADLVRSKEPKADPVDPLSSEVTEETSEEARDLASQKVEPDPELDTIPEDDMKISNEGVASASSEAVQEYPEEQTEAIDTAVPSDSGEDDRAPTGHGEGAKEIGGVPSEEVNADTVSGAQVKDEPVLTSEETKDDPALSQELDVNQREAVLPDDVSAEEVQGDSGPTDKTEGDEVKNEEFFDPVASEEAKEELSVSSEESKDGPAPIENETVSVQAVPSEEFKEEAEEAKDDPISTVPSEDAKVDSASSDAPIPVEQISVSNEEAKGEPSTDQVEADVTPITDASEGPVLTEEAKEAPVPIPIEEVNEDVQISSEADAVPSEEVNSNPPPTEQAKEQAISTEEVSEEAKDDAVTEEGKEEAIPGEETTAASEEVKDEVKTDALPSAVEADQVPEPGEQAREIPVSTDKSEADALPSENTKEETQQDATILSEAKDIPDSTDKLEADALRGDEVKVDPAPSEEVKEEAVESLPDSNDKSEVDALPSNDVKTEEVKEATEEAQAKDVPVSTDKSETDAMPSEEVKIEDVKEEAVPSEGAEAKDVPVSTDKSEADALPSEEVKAEEIKEQAVPAEEAEAEDVPDSTDKSEADDALPSEGVKIYPVEVKEEAVVPTEEAEAKEAPVSTDKWEADSSPTDEVKADTVVTEEAKQIPVSTDKSEEAAALPSDEGTKVKDPVPGSTGEAPGSQPLNPSESANQPAGAAAGDD